MSRNRSLLIALVVALLAPMPVLAQAGGQGQGRPGGMGGPGGNLMAARALLEQGSVQFLVTKAAEMQLTAEQSAALGVIAAKWTEDTKEGRDRIIAALPAPGQGMGGGDRQGMQGLMPLMQALMEQDREALDAAMKLLSEPQQAAARRLIEERRPARRPPGA
jgi:hypothetical protein